MDVTGATTDFPDLNFLVYHPGFKGLENALPAARLASNLIPSRD
jgi:hypothetical protein